MGGSIVSGISQCVTIRSDVPGNLELRTSNPRPARSSRQSRSAILRGGVSSYPRRAGHRSSALPKWFFRSLLTPRAGHQPPDIHSSPDDS